MSGAFFNSTEHDTHAGFDYDAYQRLYRKRNPERVKVWRTNQAANLLRKLGWTVTPPANDNMDTNAGKGGAAE